MEITLKEYIAHSSRLAGFDEAYADSFYDRIRKNEMLMKEYIFFVNNGSFLCEYNIEGLSLADIVVYQIDYFKAALDQERFEMKFNRDKMLLEGINTMLKMDEDETFRRKTIEKFSSISGTDRKN